MNRKRTAEAVREDAAWKCARITDDTDSKAPRWQCLGCGAFKTGTATRVVQHLMGTNQSRKCPQDQADEAFKECVEEVKKNELKKDQERSRKAVAKQVNTAASSTQAINLGLGQVSLVNSMNTHGKMACDAAIAEFFYACNIPAAVVNHPKFIQMVNTVKASPGGYKPPERHRMYSTLLDETVSSINTRLSPLRRVAMKDCGTLLSDGWDNVMRDHLVNILYGSASCIFFDGTIQLQSTDAENSDFVAELMRQAIERQGRFAFVQVVTDTCSVMQVLVSLAIRLHSSHEPYPLTQARRLLACRHRGVSS